MKTIMYKIRIVREIIEEKEININEAIKMLEAVKKFFKRILKDDINALVDSVAVFAGWREVDSETYLIRHHSG